MAVTTAIISVVTTAAQMYSQYQAGQAAAATGKRNSQVLEAAAAQAQGVANERADRSRRIAQQRLSEIRTGYAKGGVQNEGTPLIVEADAAKEMELDALTESWRGAAEATNFRNEGVMERWRGRQAQSQATMKMISTGLGGVGDFAGSSAGKSLLSGLFSSSAGSTPTRTLMGSTRYA